MRYMREESKKKKVLEKKAPLKKDPKPVAKKAKAKKTSVPVRHAVVSRKISVKINDNTKRKIEISEFKVIPKLQQVQLSRFIFLLPQEHIVANTARVSGVFFVLVGAFFSLINFQNLVVSSSPSEQVATVNMTSTQSLSTVATKPQARIVVEEVPTSINTRTVKINVPGANEVTLVANSKLGGRSRSLGNAKKIDDSNWVYTWNSSELTNGEYQLRLYIKNVYGSYESLDQNSYQILNTIENKDIKTESSVNNSPSSNSSGSTAATDPVQTQNNPGGAAHDTDDTVDTVNTSSDTDESVSNTDSSIETSDTETSTISDASSDSSVATFLPGKQVSIASIKSSVSGSIALKVNADDALGVKMYARNTSSLVSYFIGNGTRKDNTVWTVNWNTANVPNGKYSLVASGEFSGVTVQSTALHTEVSNEQGEGLTNVLPLDTIHSASSSNLASIEPNIVLKLGQKGPLSGSVDVSIETSPVMWVEMYAIQKNSLTPYFLGLATKVSPTDWSFTWLTRQSPNGEYLLYARVKTEYGSTESQRQSVKILNEINSSLTTEQENSIVEFNSVMPELIKTSTEFENVADVPLDSYPAPEVVELKSVDTFIENVNIASTSKEKIAYELDDFNSALNEKLNRLALAVRNGEIDSADAIRREIEMSKTDFMMNLSSSGESEEFEKSINAYLSERTSVLQEIAVKNEKILKERLGDALSKDSDRDDVSDYDEVNLYHTNPYSADTDGDGYIDSAELRLGYNPHSSNSEALVIYESPKESGVIRNDILTVETITNITSESESVDSPQPKRAIISGKGLPNSFVTLYVYSTPIVVTVKTDTDGSWSYIFDKELENGDHQVYVGITDNTGKIVAKSNPLSFVKTAEAFTDSEPVVQSNTTSEPSLLKADSMLLVASIAVVAIGLVLILLGLHVVNRKEESFELQTA